MDPAAIAASAATAATASQVEDPQSDWQDTSADAFSATPKRNTARSGLTGESVAPYSFGDDSMPSVFASSQDDDGELNVASWGAS